MSEIKTTSRNYMFDNIKAIMLFLVAFGHILDVYMGNQGFEYNLMKYIYLFHMPVFAFVTGYFSKNTEKSRNTAVEKCLMPYLVLQGIYVVVANVLIKLGLANFNSSIFNSSILLPSSAFYYLLAVFFWKMFSSDFLKLRYPIAISVILGLLVSVTNQSEFHKGLGAVFTLLCFFVMGVKCDQNIIAKIRKIPKIFGVLVMLLGILPAVYLPYAIHSIRLTYADAEFGILEGMGYRLAFYAIATVMGAAVINLAPQKKSILSYVGSSSILVYAGSTFLAPHAYILVANALNLTQNRWINLIGMVLFCVAIMAVCSVPIFLKWFNAVTGFIYKIIFKSKSERGEG
ncbi:MAG: hypothetical protein Q4B40_02435 [Clostridia bacterium]|nr:hypothetical protein [Clostridia bacterium]